MTDYFALLGFARSASLDSVELKRKFHALAATDHPDVSANADFAQLNVAYRTLNDPKTRLAHLLELQGASVGGVSEPPADLVDLFFDVGAALRSTDKSSIHPQTERVTRTRDEVIQRLAGIRVEDVAALRMAHQRLAFLDRWLEQLREASLAALP